MPQKRIRAIINGRVQGVFFRASTREEAQRLCLSGWVRNLASGSVEAEFQGESKAVSHLVNWLRHGPDAARVDNMETEERDLLPEREFRIIY